MQDLDDEKINEIHKKVKKEFEEGVLRELNMTGNELSMISDGGFAHRFCVALVNFYESVGGKNYFTTTVETTVKGERKRYEITIRNLQGDKSPAEVIAKLKENNEELQEEIERLEGEIQDMESVEWI